MILRLTPYALRLCVPAIILLLAGLFQACVEPDLTLTPVPNPPTPVVTTVELPVGHYLNCGDITGPRQVEGRWSVSILEANGSTSEFRAGTFITSNNDRESSGARTVLVETPDRGTFSIFLTLEFLECSSCCSQEISIARDPEVACPVFPGRGLPQFIGMIAMINQTNIPSPAVMQTELFTCLNCNAGDCN